MQEDVNKARCLDFCNVKIAVPQNQDRICIPVCQCSSSEFETIMACLQGDGFFLDLLMKSTIFAYSLDAPHGRAAAEEESQFLGG